MIKNFAYVKAGSIAAAVKALSTKGARLHAGGTDLMGCMRDEVISRRTRSSASAASRN